jgi:hypothetical protein
LIIEVHHEHVVSSPFVVDGPPDFVLEGNVALDFSLWLLQLQLLSLGCDIGAISLIDHDFDISCEPSHALSRLLDVEAFLLVEVFLLTKLMQALFDFLSIMANVLHKSMHVI